MKSAQLELVENERASADAVSSGVGVFSGGNGSESRLRASGSRFPRDAIRVVRRLAFTLIELMVVVAIIAIIMTIGIPFVRMAIDNGKGMTKAMKDIQEACSHARAIAILQQTDCALRIRPGDGVFEVGVPSGGANSEMGSRGEPGKGFSARLPEGIRIEGLGVNGEDWTEDEEAVVWFKPVGTCDAMSVVLLSDDNERRNIWLDIVTGLPEVESDPERFRAR